MKWTLNCRPLAYPSSAAANTEKKKITWCSLPLDLHKRKATWEMQFTAVN